MSAPVTSPTILPPLDGIPALLTTDEVAAIFRVNPRTVERWTSDGRLHRVELGARTVRFRAEDVAALIDAQNDHEAAANGPVGKVGNSSARPGS
jgi:excisionase family DNA binding protein